jgi:hypothetical protein
MSRPLVLALEALTLLLPAVVVAGSPGERMATWRDEARARVLRSAAALRQAVARGELTLRRSGIVGPQDLTPVTSWA